MRQRVIAAALAGMALAAPAWAADRVELTTRVSGVVEEVLVKPGQRVAKGAVLARLDRTVLIEFDSVEQAAAVHDSADYQAALAALGNGAVRDLRIVEGVA